MVANTMKNLNTFEKWKEHRKKLKGAELPYIPYLSEELCIPDEITAEIGRGTERGEILKKMMEVIKHGTK